MCTPTLLPGLLIAFILKMICGTCRFVICPNYEDGTMYFNGNDAVTLSIRGDLMFLEKSEDPGEAWGDENGTYLDKRPNFSSAVLLEDFSFTTYSFVLEWDSLPQNTFTELGQHTCNCSDNMYF